MAKGDIHTTWDSKTKKWKNTAEGGQRASGTGPRKADVETAGNKLAKKKGVEHVIHGKDGKIQERNGPFAPRKDPRRSKG